MTKKSICFIFVSNLCLFLILFNCLNYEGKDTINSLKLNGSVALESTGVMYESKEEFNEDLKYLEEKGYNYIFYKLANNDNVIEMTCSNYQLVINYDCSSNETIKLDGMTYAPLKDSTMETFLAIEGLSFQEVQEELKLTSFVMVTARPHEFTKSMIVSFLLLMLIVTLLYSYLSLQFTKRQLNVFLLIGYSDLKTLLYFMTRYTIIQLIVSLVVFITNYNYFLQYQIYQSFLDVLSPTIMLLICNAIIFGYNTIILTIIIKSQTNEFRTLEEIGL